MNTYQNINSTKTPAHAECAPTVALHDLDVDTLYQAIDPTSWEDDPCEYPVTVMLDDVEYGSKAEVIASIQEVNSRISERKQTLGLAALADAVTQGRTFVPGVIEGSRRSENWKSQQVFPLDFDGGESIEEHLQACEYLELWPVFVYPSFSHTEEAPRFRSVFVTDKPVEDVQLREEILGELHRLFPKADTKCKDPARLFFGTKSAIAYERWDARFPVSKFEAREHFADSNPSSKNPSAAPSEDEAVQLLAKHWKEGQRNELSLAVSGMLLRAHWEDSRIEALIRRVCAMASDTDCATRTRSVAETRRKLSKGEPVTGGPVLARIFGDNDEYARLRHSLGIMSPDAALESNVSTGKGKAHIPIEERNGYTDEGNAKAFAKLHQEHIAYIASRDVNDWASWDGTKWRIGQSSKAFRLCSQTLDALQAQAMVDEDDGRRARMLDHLVKTRNRNGLQNMLEVARHLECLQRNSTEFDTEPELINHPNGIVSLRSFELLEHAPAYRITKCAITKYVATGPEPENWLRTLAFAFGDDAALIRWFGKSIARSFLFQGNRDIFYICYGTGANGKTTIFDALRRVFGADYITTADPGTFMKESDATRNALARLRGVKLVIGSESPDGGLFNEALMKRVTSGEEIEAKSLYKDIFTFTPQFTMFFLTNHKPVIRGTDYGIWRRARLVPFSHKIPENQRDPHILQKLVSEESEGIVRWVYEHLRLFLEEGEGDLPEAVQRATADYQQDSNITLNFLTECCVPDETAKISLKELYKAYACYRQSRGLNPGKDYALRSDLEKMDVLVKRQSGGNFVYGYRFEPTAHGEVYL